MPHPTSHSSSMRLLSALLASLALSLAACGGTCDNCRRGLQAVRVDATAHMLAMVDAVRASPKCGLARRRVMSFA